MQKGTVLSLVLSFLLASPLFGQQTDFVLDVPHDTDPTDPFSDNHNGGQFGGGHSVNGPFDLDGDGLVEILVGDFSGGGRVHVVENTGADAWELVYSTPWIDPTSSTNNARYATGGDLDGDGLGEIIFTSGNSFRDEIANEFRPGIYVYEYTGTDNDYGTAPAGVYTLLDAHASEGDMGRVKSDNFSVMDIDGDGREELLYPNDGFGSFDEWYVISVEGDIGSGFEVWVEELRLSSKNSGEAAYDPVNRGGGSVYAINAANLDGEPGLELSLHSWNDYNFTNARVDSADSYSTPGVDDPNVFLHGTPGNDDLSWFNGVVVDINQDGDDEVFYPREYGFVDDSLGIYEYVTVLNYETGEDPLQITTDQLNVDLVGPLTAYGIDAGDVNGDGWMDLIGAGRGFAGSDLSAGRNPVYLRIAEWVGGVGGDPEDASNYVITPVEFEPTINDSLFNRIERDSAGTTTVYWESAGSSGAFPEGRPEEISPAKIAYLGDADGDSFAEMAVSFFGINDSLQVIDEVWNADSLRYERTVRETAAAPTRPMVRIFEFNEILTALPNEVDLILPSDYKLSGNYPNPFNPTTTFSFTLPVDKAVSVRVYDVTGRLVRTLVDDQRFVKGTHELSWDGRDMAGRAVASGAYLYTLEYGNFRQTRKMTLLR